MRKTGAVSTTTQKCFFSLFLLPYQVSLTYTDHEKARLLNVVTQRQQSYNTMTILPTHVHTKTHLPLAANKHEIAVYFLTGPLSFRHAIMKVNF